MQFKVIFLCLLGWSTATMAQDSTLFIVDSVESVNGLGNLTPDKIAFINIVKSPTLQEKYGAKAANGIMYIETKPFARKRFTRLFSSISPDFEAAIKKAGGDSTFQYVLDGQKIDDTTMNMLAALEKNTIANIAVIDAKALKGQYQVKDKKVGVVITSK